MSYKDLTAKQIFKEEVNYSLNDFVKDFRQTLKQSWGSERIDKVTNNKSLYQGILLLVVLTSQDKSLRLICEVVMGKSTDEVMKMTKDIIDMYGQEIEVLRGLQMKMFLDNLKKYYLSESLNLKLLNADFHSWLEEALKRKD
jgi:hypothetical protein